MVFGLTLCHLETAAGNDSVGGECASRPLCLLELCLYSSSIMEFCLKIPSGNRCSGKGQRCICPLQRVWLAISSLYLVDCQWSQTFGGVVDSTTHAATSESHCV